LWQSEHCCVGEVGMCSGDLKVVVRIGTWQALQVRGRPLAGIPLL